MAAETASAYAVGLQDLPIHAVELACKDLGYRARAEYETAWPELGAIRERAVTILKLERERADSNRLLLQAPNVPELSPEKKAEIMAQFRAVLSKKVMP